MENINHNINEEKINKILELTEENNQIIKKMRKVQKNSKYFRNIYWIIILATALGLFILYKNILIICLLIMKI